MKVYVLGVQWSNEIDDVIGVYADEEKAILEGREIVKNHKETKSEYELRILNYHIRPMEIIK